MFIKSTSLYLCLTWDNLITGEHHEHIGPLPIAIGRAASLNTIVLDSKQVSRQHAWLERVGNKLILIDQDSTNGTLVNSQRIKCATLKDGDTFQIPPFTFTLTTAFRYSSNKVSQFDLDHGVTQIFNGNGTGWLFPLT